MLKIIDLIYLENRINNIINKPIFVEVLNSGGEDLIDFQFNWYKYQVFENLPELYQRAIIMAENAK